MINIFKTRLSLAFFHLVMLVCIIGACASPELMHNDFLEGASATVLQWPPPPQKPRILYLGSIKDPIDPGRRQSWFKKVMSSVFGSEGDMSTMLRPYGIYADADRVYVSDPGSSRFHVYDRTQKSYFAVEMWGEEDLISPIGIAVDKDGHVFVSDSILKQVFVFDRGGKYLRAIGPPDMFQRPVGIALDDDRIYVVDTYAHKIRVLSQTDGRLLLSFGKQGTEHGSFNYPTNIFVSNEKLIYVTDSMNFRVQVFNPDGSFLTSFGKPGDGSGNFSKPKGVAVDSEGHIYVVDSHFENVQIFDRDGNLLLVFGGSGNGKGEFTLPSGIYIDKLDRIYIADSYNRRIQIFQYVKEEKEKVAK
jgi:DNA-binding beta-propeller fold protein YncE